mgnify:CR=1 FL=1
MGALVGVPFFLLAYYGQMFGPNMDLIGSVGIAFGSAFGVAMCSYVMSKNKLEDK